MQELNHHPKGEIETGLSMPGAGIQNVPGWIFNCSLWGLVDIVRAQTVCPGCWRNEHVVSRTCSLHKQPPGHILDVPRQRILAQQEWS